MKLEDQVCSLESAKRLKELGVRQESLFYWVTIPSLKYILNQPIPNSLHNENFIIPHDDHRRWTHEDFKNNCSAFTVAELGELLKEQDLGNVFYSTHGWNFFNKDGMCDHTDAVPTEAEARALMLIYLLENKLVEAK